MGQSFMQYIQREVKEESKIMEASTKEESRIMEASTKAAFAL